MLDGPALRFGGLLGPGICQLVGSGVATDILVNLLRRSSLLQGDLWRRAIISKGNR